MIDASRLTEARTRAASYMTATATITRSGAPTFNTSTGTIAATDTAVWTGKVGVSDQRANTSVQGGQVRLGVEVRLRAPIAAAAAVRPGDKVTITNPGDWPALPAQMWVDRIEGRTTAVAARIICTTKQPGADQ